MAKKASTAATSNARESAMDYAQHEATWNGFITLTQWVIVALAFIVVALYCFIEANQPVLGTLLLLVLPVGAVALIVSRARTAS